MPSLVIPISWIVHTSSAYTSALHKSFISLTSHAHSGIYVSEMKNLLCWVHGVHVFSQVYIELYRTCNYLQKFYGFEC